MVEIRNVITTYKFEKEFKKIDNSIKEKLKKQMQKVIHNPEVGKPLSYDLKGERTVYVKPYRLIYKIDLDKLILLRVEHRENVYD